MFHFMVLLFEPFKLYYLFQGKVLINNLAQNWLYYINNIHILPYQLVLSHSQMRMAVDELRIYCQPERTYY